MKVKKIKVIKLGTECFDKATELQGTVTHWTLSMGGNINYFFQPRALDESGQPVDHLFLEEQRLSVKSGDWEEVEVPLFNLLGTIVEDKASGFKGMAVAFLRHINGCFHVFIQPSGLNEKTHSPIQKRDFDVRSCTSPLIEELSPEKLEESKKKTPSPSSFGSQFEPRLKRL